MKKPLVSVICLCYNQARFVNEALDSVVKQNYEAIELIIVDDGSSDGSKEVIKQWLLENPHFPYLDLDENVGNTTAFNQGLNLATGQYVIDLAADDVLMPERVEKQVSFFKKQDSNVGVIYSDAQYISKNGYLLHVHFEDSGMVPYHGDVYERVVDTYFIPPPTMMMRKDVLDQLGGYDESLAYEDFDFWVRSARNWHYAYQSEVLTQIRQVKGSHSDGYFAKRDQKMNSTIRVCHKISELNQTQEENLALIKRLKYEIRHAFLAGRKNEMNDFFGVWEGIAAVTTWYIIIRCIGQLGLNLNWVRKLFRIAKGS